MRAAGGKFAPVAETQIEPHNPQCPAADRNWGGTHLRLRRDKRNAQARQRMSGRPPQQTPVHGADTQQHELSLASHRRHSHRKLRQPHQTRITVVIAHSAEKP